MGVEINISTLRHLIIAFERRLDGKAGMPTELSKEEVEELYEAADAEAREIQSGHSPETAHGIYALDLRNMFTRQFHQPAAHYKTSTRWHKALGFASHEPDIKESRSAIHPTTEALELRCNANYKALLRENLGPKAKYRGCQQDALKAILEGTAVVPYVAGTGAGKSLLFQLPTCFPGYEKVIVIVPLVALRTDIAARCAAMDIKTTVWEQGQCDENAHIIFATPENITNSTFQGFVHRLRSQRRLERIVVDEFHFILLPDSEYRPHLLSLRSLTQYATPLTFLSATIPVARQQEALRLAGVPGDTRVYREPTVRTNMAYEVREVEVRDDSREKDLIRYIQHVQRTELKVLVFVDHATMVESLSGQMDWHGYHGQMSAEDRAHNQGAFAANAFGVMIATSAFTTGVHIPDIRMVLWIGKPSNFIVFLQASGRGGRDGLPCITRVLLSSGIPNWHFDKAKQAEQDQVNRFLQPPYRDTKCRRRVIDAFMDGDEKRLHCREEEASCDKCVVLFSAKPKTALVTPVRREGRRTMREDSTPEAYVLSTTKGSESSRVPPPVFQTPQPTTVTQSGRKRHVRNTTLTSPTALSSPSKRVQGSCKQHDGDMMSNVLTRYSKPRHFLFASANLLCQCCLQSSAQRTTTRLQPRAVEPSNQRDNTVVPGRPPRHSTVLDR